MSPRRAPHPVQAAAVAPLRLVVLGASGATGRLVVERALHRGHEVHALVRDPARYDVEGELVARGVQVHHADVHDPSAVASAVQSVQSADSDDESSTVVVSALGVTSTAQTGTLTAGASAVLAAGARHIVWMGAVGTGRSEQAVRTPTRLLLRAVFGAELHDKTTADSQILDAGHTVVHCGRLVDGTAEGWGWLPLSDVPIRWWPTDTPRAAAAAVLVRHAELCSDTSGLVVAQRAG